MKVYGLILNYCHFLLIKILNLNPVGNCMFRVNNKNTKTRCEMCSKLKLVSAIFYQIFVFHQMIAHQKLWKVFFISSKKLFSFSRYSNFCNFSLPFHTFQIQKDKWKWNNFTNFMSWIGLHKFADAISEITQQLCHITSSNLVR